jgi:GTP cyclohydrolase I
VEIADSIETRLAPLGTFVILEAEHLCMSMRGIKKPGSKTSTSAVRGIFHSDPASRAEAISLMCGN